jgi:cell wall assembly regulator SMI1
MDGTDGSRELDAALAALAREVHRLGGGTGGSATLFSGHDTGNVRGGGLRQIDGHPAPAGYPDHDLLPPIREALPGPPRHCAIELRTEADGSWSATLCWADDLDCFLGRKRVLREGVEPPAPPISPLPAPDPGLLAARWDQVRAQHRPNPPATAAEITATEAQLGRPLPEPLRALYALADGAPIDWTVVEEDGAGLLAGHDWLTLAQLRSRWAEDRRFGADPLSPFDRVRETRPGVTATTQVHPGWLPIGADGGGNLLALDLAPGPNGRPGQLIAHGSDLTDGPGLVAWSLEDLLRGIAPPPAPLREPTLVIDVRRSGATSLRTEQIRPAAREVSLFGFDHLDTAPLRACRELRELRLRSRTVDLAGAAATPVELLVLLDQRHVDLSPLAGQPTLDEIRISDLADGATLSGLEVLGTLPRLRRLTLPTWAWPPAVPGLQARDQLLVAEFDDTTPLAHTVAVAAAFDRPGRVLATDTLTRTGQLGPG